MASYADQIPVEDRWRIVAYVKTLQRSQKPSADDVNFAAAHAEPTQDDSDAAHEQH